MCPAAGFLPIFRSLGIPKCLHYLPHVLPRLLKLAEADTLILREYSLGQITGHRSHLNASPPQSHTPALA